MWKSFTEFFGAATEGREPYPYQIRFAESSPLPHLLRAPTGAGKTAAAVLGWLYRWQTKKPDTPRRLVYCLPMRVLVEQSFAATLGWLHRLHLLDARADFDPDDLKQIAEYRPRLDDTTAGKIAVYRLMGGVEREKWYLYPERPAILIGTQDMLLSRALNRGYAASRFHWPIDFGLLNNDCLWVFDEPQLMGSGVSTSAQLAGLRPKLGTFGPCPSVWMSATLEPAWLDTVDFRGQLTTPPLELDAEDYAEERPLYKRMTAAKTLHLLGATVSKDGKDVAQKVWDAHQKQGKQTLVVLNRVDRAKAVYDGLRKLRKKSESPKLLLVHSRFRPAERERLNATLQDKGEAAKDRIIVATQVVEAGVDISSRTLVTELAPWASVVQRIGRCNRTGDDGTKDDPAWVFWIDQPEVAKLAELKIAGKPSSEIEKARKEADKAGLPYAADELVRARSYLITLAEQSVSPKSLDDFKRDAKITLPFEHTHVVRRRDLLDLFDTAPDLSGNDIDISRFVRGDDSDTDLQVFWRNIGSDGPPEDEPEPVRRELCSVPVGQARGFLESLAKKKQRAGYVWDHLEEEWSRLDPKRIRPGLEILLPATAGGYSDLGWDPDSPATVEPLPPEGDERRRGEAAGSDRNSETSAEVTITQHTANVCAELELLLAALGALSDEWVAHLRSSARWHDAGKGHWAFQHGVRSANPKLSPGQLWAKSGTNGRLRHGRPHFRHELASTLAALRHGVGFESAYLIGGHHGRVRLGIRALPGEEPPDDPNGRFALGVRDGDAVPEVDLGCGVVCPATPLDLSPMQLGGPESWTGRALALLTESGPFKLAYLEAMLRAADVRASQKEAGRA